MHTVQRILSKRKKYIYSYNALQRRHSAFLSAVPLYLEILLLEVFGMSGAFYTRYFLDLKRVVESRLINYLNSLLLNLVGEVARLTNNTNGEMDDATMDGRPFRTYK